MTWHVVFHRQNEHGEIFPCLLASNADSMIEAVTELAHIAVTEGMKNDGWRPGKATVFHESPINLMVSEAKKDWRTAPLWSVDGT